MKPYHVILYFSDKKCVLSAFMGKI